MNKDTEKTKVIFRTSKWSGEVLAVFPSLAGTNKYYDDCLSYVHIGQHGSAGLEYISKRTRPAKPEEYAALQSELESIGYNLQIAKRFTRKDLEARKEQCRR